jgi:hypothetical protein
MPPDIMDEAENRIKIKNDHKQAKSIKIKANNQGQMELR